MDIEPIGPVWAVSPVMPVLHHGPHGEAYERDGPEARWGEGKAAAAAYDARIRDAAAVRLRGEVRPPTPFVPPHHERWGAYFWLAGDHGLTRVLLGPVPAFRAPALRVAPHDAVEVVGYPVHLHGEDALVAAHVRKGRETAVLLDAGRRRPGAVPTSPDR
jgi:hypothetical protein